MAAFGWRSVPLTTIEENKLTYGCWQSSFCQQP